MNMAKKQNSFSSTKRDRNGETVPAIAGVEINEIRMYSIEGKMYLPETDLPKLEYRLKAKNFIAERFTGMTDSYGIPIFEGDVMYQEYWLENMKLDMWHFVCWDEKLGCFIARCCNQDGVAEYDDPYDRNGYAPMLREWVEEKTVIGNIHCHNTSKDGCTITDFYKYASPSPYSGIVADREICMSIKKEYPDEFNKSIFVWSYSPFKSQCSIQLRKKEFPPHYIIFPAPTADEIISKLPHDWYGVDEASFAENNWLKPGIVTSETRFELQIEKNSFNEISCMNAMDNGHGISAFSEMAPDTQKLSTGLLGAWFFMMRNRKIS